MAFEYPLPEPLLVILERQIPVGGLLLYRVSSAEFALRVDEFVRAEGAAALLALVAIGSFGAALRAGADDVAVSQESLGLRVIVLLALTGDELALIVEFLEKLRSVLGVDGRRGAAIDVEIDAQAGERVLYDSMLAVNQNIKRT